MRKWILPLLFAVGLCVGAASAQVSQESVNVQNFVPTGACTTSPLVKVSNVGTYQCVAGAWTKVGPSMAAAGTVTSFSASGAVPLFATSVATPTTTPALTFVMSTAPAGAVYGNFTGAAAVPAFSVAPAFSGANLTALNASNLTTGTVAAARVALLNQSTTGNAATATALASAPTTCVILGQYAKGILTSGAPSSCLSPVVSGVLVVTTDGAVAGSQAITITGVGSASACTFSPVNAGAAGELGVFLPEPTANTVTLKLGTTATAGDSFNVVCTNNF